MAMKKTLGGDRLGSGNRMKVELHNYGRSTFNMGRAWRSSMTAGTLVPFMVEPALNGDTFDIDIHALVRTVPTMGVLFGSAKLQADVFVCPMRLYNKQLHNNKLNVGMDMSKVLFPLIRMYGGRSTGYSDTLNQDQISSSSLAAYLGIRGIGQPINGTDVYRDFNAMPILAYYDIFKNYYANKQEENAYVIGGEFITNENEGKAIRLIRDYNTQAEAGRHEFEGEIWWSFGNAPQNRKFEILGRYLNTEGGFDSIELRFRQYTGGQSTTQWRGSLAQAITAGYITVDQQIEYQTHIRFTVASATTRTGYLSIKAIDAESLLERVKPILIPFPLENIDKMRENILEAPSEIPYYITTMQSSNLMNDDTEPLPYSVLNTKAYEELASGMHPFTMANAPMAGLVVKTHQSDRFNNWLNEEWIAGANGIAEISAVDVSDGTLKMDALNLAQKVYNMLNRIAVSGGSYRDWQDAVYGQSAYYAAETPIFVGGISQEINFGEITSTSNDGKDSPLGTLAAKGYAQGGGEHIHIKIEEPSYIIGIVSITPRVDYSQGNKWFGNIRTMDDWHKPEFGGIGFQELITDEIAAYDTKLVMPSTWNDEPEVQFKSAGKQPAWIQYQTSQNEVYGTFANKYFEEFMVFNRYYSPDSNGNIEDLTTYIDPEMYNQNFTRTDLGAQNYWVQLGIDVTARRKMSANQIPNL